MTEDITGPVRATRRIFLRNTVLATTFPLAAPAALSEVSLGKSSMPTHLVFDTRVAAKPKVNFDANISIASIHSFDGDITSLWIETLQPLWAGGGTATAGLTRHAEFFLLRTLAQEHAYRVAKTVEDTDHVSWLMLPGD